MGERDNHIDQGTSLRSEGELLTHEHGERERELLIERCSPEEMKEMAAAATTAMATATAVAMALGGSGPWPPYSSLEMMLLCKLISPSRRLPRGRKFRGAP